MKHRYSQNFDLLFAFCSLELVRSTLVAEKSIHLSVHNTRKSMVSTNMLLNNISCRLKNYTISLF